MTAAPFSAVLQKWWYYTVELAPGVTAKGAYPPVLPMLPRMMLRGVDLKGADCLDVGSMEGLIPALMARGGASRVMASDAVDHCVEKMAALKQAYGVDFGFARVGLAYEMARKLAPQGGFDLINLSGVLYHVFSPMHVFAGLRPLLKRNGLMIVSQNVVRREGCSMEFNDQGRLQGEPNTFWYHSAPMLEYMIRYFGLVPIDCLFWPHANPAEGVDSGYLSIVCRAVDEPIVHAADPWAARSWQQSWEVQALLDRKMMDAQPVSSIGYTSDRGVAAVPKGLDLLSAARDEARTVASVDNLRDSHHLRLADVD